MQDYSTNKELPFSEPVRSEIHEGKIYYMAGTSTDHNFASTNILAIFKTFLKGKKCQVFGENVDVTFKRNFRRFMPDVKIVCDPDKIKKDGIYGAPDLIVEVISKSTAKNDKDYKFKIYELYGVKEYWIIDINNKSIEVYFLKENKFELDNIYYHFSDEEIKEIEEAEEEYATADIKAEKELIKIKSFKTSVFGDDLIISIADVFENI